MKPERKSCGFKTIRIRVIRRASLVLVLFGFSFIDMFSMFSVFTCYKHFLVIKRLHPRKMCLIIIPLLKTFTLGFDCLCDFSISFDSRTYPLELKRNAAFTGAYHSTQNSGAKFRKFSWANGTVFFQCGAAVAYDVYPGTKHNGA